MCSYVCVRMRARVCAGVRVCIFERGPLLHTALVYVCVCVCVYLCVCDCMCVRVCVCVHM